MTKKEFYNYLTWMFETFSKTIQEVNKQTRYRTTKQTLVFDLDQFSMRQLTIKPGKKKLLLSLRNRNDNFLKPELL